MDRNVPTALALTVSVACTVAVAQEQGGADANADGIVSREEATAHSEALFDRMSEGGEMNVGQFVAANAATEADLSDEEAATAANPDTALDRADADQSGSVSRDEWLNWRLEQFDEAAGGPAQGGVEPTEGGGDTDGHVGAEEEGGIEAAHYETLYSRGMPGVEDGGDVLIEEAPIDDSARFGQGGPDAGGDAGSEGAGN